MSASSWCVTCGTLSQDRCRTGPEIFLMRASGRVSTGPNFAKSTAGISGMPVPTAAGAAAGAAGAGPRRNASRSSLVMRPFGPAPVTAVRSTPSSRAVRRTLGPACTPAKSVPAATVSGGAGGAAGGRTATSGSCCSTRDGGCTVAPSPGSTSASSAPSLTRSPTLTGISRITPATGAGTSIVALSDSSVTNGSSALMRSPGETWTSMIGTSEKSPMSGTLISIAAAMSFPLHPGRVGLVRVDAVSGDRVGHGGSRGGTLVGQRAQRGEDDVVPVDFEEPAQVAAVVRAAEAVGSQHGVAAGYERPDLVGEGLQGVAGRDVRTLAAQFGEARHAPHVCAHPEVLREQVRAGDDLAQDRAAAQQLHAGTAAGALAQQVHAAQDPFLGALGHGRVPVVLVHDGQVVVHVLLLGVHAPQPVVDDDGHLVGVRRVVRHAVRDRRRDQVAVPVLVLQSLPVEGGATRGTA